jgi:Fe-S-cluster containining protein
MAEFVCTRCGKCCISLGRHIRIERSLSPIQHYCRIAITGEIVPVAIAPEHREIHAAGESEAGWCPFLRRTPDKTFICTIYGSRPAICREFQCRTMVIYDRQGKEAGYVSGKSCLTTSDPLLLRLWNDLLRSGQSSPEQVMQHLACHGYRAEPLS